MSMLQARFKCVEIRKDEAAEHVVLMPVYSEDKKDPNYTWSQATPAGRLNMTISAKGAMGKFKVGETYALDFSTM